MELSTSAIIDIFEAAFQTHDPSQLATIVGDNCRLENTGPAPDGATYSGGAACVAFWSGVASNRNLRFEEEHIDILGERAIITWRLVWGEDRQQSVRGVNIMKVQAGKIVEALGYVKG
ncbi:MAG TPA: nuclear transport factor 2 family protein [Bacillota bacterium]|nr:nuclear transport factor 2 family protein [Bacillota bacterium]